MPARDDRPLQRIGAYDLAKPGVSMNKMAIAACDHEMHLRRTAANDDEVACALSLSKTGAKPDLDRNGSTKDARVFRKA